MMDRLLRKLAQFLVRWPELEKSAAFAAPFAMFALVLFVLWPFLGSFDASPRSPWMIGLIFLVLLIVLIHRDLLVHLARERVEKSYTDNDNLKVSRLGGQAEDPSVRLAIFRLNRAEIRKSPASLLNTANSNAVNAVMAAIQSKWISLSCSVKLTELSDKLGEITGRFGVIADKRFERVTELLDRLQSRINDEYADIVSRTGWLLTTQAFLLTAFFTATNSDRLDSTAKYWASFGIALTGALIAHLVARAIFIGHALIERLKKPRDFIETLAHDEFGFPRVGLSVGDGSGVDEIGRAHRMGYAATRYLPALAYVTWSVLALLTYCDLLSSPPATALVPTDTIAATSLGSGWRALRPSPPFALGAETFDARVTGCRSPEETRKAVDEWVSEVVAAWMGRPRPSVNDTLILVGGADRVHLGAKLKDQYDSNIALATKRAQSVKNLLIGATEKKEPEHKITDDRALLLVTGPMFTPSSPSSPNATSVLCSDKELSKDRVVRVWLPVSR